jgi:hypothetical protein
MTPRFRKATFTPCEARKATFLNREFMKVAFLNSGVGRRARRSG